MDIEDPTPPSAPIWVQKSLPDAWPERGIDAHESGGIFLEWQHNPEDNIAAYLVYRAEYFDYEDSLGEYIFVSIVENDSNTELNYIDYSANLRTSYYYKLVAEDKAQNLSLFSDSTEYTLLPSIDRETMHPNGNSDILNNNRLLYWNYYFDTEMEDYCLTVLALNNDLILRVQLSPTDYVNGRESWQIPDSVVLETDITFKWRIDIGARYIDHLETSGSESTWATFLYNNN